MVEQGALFLDPQRPARRTLARILRSAGYEVAEDGDAQTAGLLVAELEQREALLARLQAGAQGLLLGAAAALRPEDLCHPGLLGYVGVSLDEPQAQGELHCAVLAAARHAQGHPLPPLQALLCFGARAYAAAVRDVAGRDQAVAQVRELCVHSLRAPRRQGEAAAEVAHELLTNAMYTAPVDERGAPRYAHDRSAPIQLPESEQVSFTLGSDGVRLALEVSDRFGRLSREALAQSLQRGASGQVQRGAGGAGIGLSMVLRRCERLQIEVLPGQRTRVTAVLRLDADAGGAARSLLLTRAPRGTAGPGGAA